MTRPCPCHPFYMTFISLGKWVQGGTARSPVPHSSTSSSPRREHHLRSQETRTERASITSDPRRPGSLWASITVSCVWMPPSTLWGAQAWHSNPSKWISSHCPQKGAQDKGKGSYSDQALLWKGTTVCQPPNKRSKNPCLNSTRAVSLPAQPQGVDV